MRLHLRGLWVVVVLLVLAMPVLGQNELPTAQELFDQGDAAAATGDYEIAITAYTAALEIDPTSAMTYNRRGLAYEALGDYEQAAADHTRAIEFEPSNTEYLQDRARANYLLGDFSASIADYNLVLQLLPNDAITLNRRGYAYLLLEQVERAITDFTSAVDSDPSLAWAYNNRAIAYRTQEDYELALTDHDRAIEIDPMYWWAYESRAVTHALAGDLDSAIEDLSRVIDAGQTWIMAYFDRATYYLQTERIEEALADLEVYVTRESLELVQEDAPGIGDTLVLELDLNTGYRLPVEVPAETAIAVTVQVVEGEVNPLVLLLDTENRPLAMAEQDTTGFYRIPAYPVETGGTYAVMVTHAGFPAEGEVSVAVALLNPDGSDLCTVTVSGTQPVNRRDSPSTAAAVAGIINPGENAPVIGQTEGADGFTWWQLEESAWVRDDVVALSGDCTGIPQR